MKLPAPRGGVSSRSSLKFNVASDGELDPKRLIGEAKTEQDIFGKGGLIKALSKRLIERMLESEMDHHLGYEKHAVVGNNSGNSRNGKSSKQVILENGKVDITVPRDRNSEIQPPIDREA